MAHAEGPFLIQDADDGPGILTPADAGKFLAVRDDASGFFLSAPQTVIHNNVGAMRSGFYAIQDARDGPGTLTIASDGKALTWNQATGHFVMATLNAADADTLDGHDSTYFLPAASYTAADVLAKLLTVDGAGSTLDADTLDGHDTSFFLAASAYTAADVLSKIETVDGTGSGLDADLLDGLDSLAFVKADGTVTGASAQRQTFTNGLTAPSVRPLADSTSAYQIQKTDGTPVIVIDTTNGYLGIGTTPATILDVSGAAGSMFYTRTSADANGFGQRFRKVRGTSTIVSSGDELGWIDFLGWDGAVYRRAALIYAQVDGTPGSADMPGRLTFWTTLDGAATSVERMRLDNRGYFSIGLGATPTLTALLHLAAGTTARASQRIVVGSAPTTPNDGDLWHDGALTFYGEDATTATIVDTIRLRRESSGTPAAGFGVGIGARLESATVSNRDVGRLTFEWVTATDASRAARGKLSAFYTTTERTCLSWEANSTVPMIGFLGTTPAALPAAYTQTYSTATRIFSAYTLNDQSAAYTGQDNLQVGTVYAKLTDLNTLRTAYETLRAHAEVQGKLINSLIDDFQAYGLMA